MDALLQLLLRILPPGSAVAGTLHLLRGVLGVERPAQHEHHLCHCERHFWPPSPKSTWSLTTSDPCPNCNTEHFVESKTKPGQAIPSGVVSSKSQLHKTGEA
jgi:hypothetical protein